MDQSPHYLPLRKKKLAMTDPDAWDVLESPDTHYGFLGTGGVPEEGNVPYVIPMNFVADRDSNSIYLHTTLDADSKRNRSLAGSPRVCFTVVHPDAAQVNDGSGLPCKFSMRFRSVMAMGRIRAVNSLDERARILNMLMRQKAPHAKLTMDVQPPHTAIATILRINVEHITGMNKP
jgi:nitroimidazol reductase NimA-like FMN-containing flavoprotein (pyridoxamine 5'-phosphate oxidase superfamily)